MHPVAWWALARYIPCLFYDFQLCKNIRLNFEFWKNSKFSNSFRLQQNEEFWNKHRLCADEVPSACRFERKARLRLSGWVLVESTALFSCYFRNSTFDLFIFSKTSQCNSHTHLSAFIRAEGLTARRFAVRRWSIGSILSFSKIKIRPI